MVLFSSPVVVVFESSCCNWEESKHFSLRKAENLMATACLKWLMSGEGEVFSKIPVFLKFCVLWA